MSRPDSGTIGVLLDAMQDGRAWNSRMAAPRVGKDVTRAGKTLRDMWLDGRLVRRPMPHEPGVSVRYEYTLPQFADSSFVAVGGPEQQRPPRIEKPRKVRAKPRRQIIPEPPDTGPEIPWRGEWHGNVLDYFEVRA